MYPQKTLLDTLRMLRCSQSCFAAISGVNPGQLSQFLRGYVNFSPVARDRIDQGLKDLVQLAQETSAPIDFRQIGEVRAAIERIHAKSEREKVAVGGVR